jgi:hypothetical protein
MIFCLVYFLNRYSDNTYDLFLCRRATFHGCYRIIYVSFLLWWGGVHDGAKV